MWPEAFTFADLFQMLKGYKKLKTAVDLPKWAVLNHRRWKWLLPGNFLILDNSWTSGLPGRLASGHFLKLCQFKRWPKMIVISFVHL